MATMQENDIKRVNQQMIELSKIETYDSSNLTKFINTIQQIGLETKVITSKQTGQQVLQIRNTKANREKIPSLGLSNTISQKGGKTAKELRANVQQQLKSQGKKATSKDVTRELKVRQAIKNLEDEFNLIPSDILYEQNIDTNIFEYSRVALNLLQRIEEFIQYARSPETPVELIDYAMEEVLNEIRSYQGFNYSKDQIISYLGG